MFEADSSSSVVSSTSSTNGIANIQNKANGTKGSAEGDQGRGSNETGEESKAKKPEARTVERKQSNSEQSSALSSTTKTKAPKFCQVCGDTAKSFHFGGLSCDSCKAFFRRSVHNDGYEGFRCAYNGQCEITKNSRKSCQYCRFQKCISIGMEKKWVMTEEERIQLKQKKQTREGPSATDAGTSENEEDHYEPNVNEMLNYMTQEEKDEIECIVNKYQHSYREIPFRVSQSGGKRNTVEIIQMFTTILRRFAYFTKLFPEFTQLSIPDQSTLLRASVLEMCLLRGALCFDMKNNRWPKTENMEFLKDCPQLRVEDMEKLVSKDLYDMHIQFINGVQELGADEPTVMILLLIVLFYPERGALEHQEYIASCQEKYLFLLNKYVRWRYGPKGTKTFPRLLTKLADLRQLNDSHTEYNLKMTKNEVETIQEQLGNLNLNPYPQWVLVQDQLNDSRESSHSANSMTPNLVYDSPSAEHAGVGQSQAHSEANNAAAYQQIYSQQQGHGQMPSGLQPRDFFMQFVNHKIPALINNPFTPFSMEAELANARSFFQNSMGMGFPGMQQMQMDPNIQHHEQQSHIQEEESRAGQQPISQFRQLLETSDPNMLRQLKGSLSPDVLSKLQSVFGSGNVASGGQFDLSSIPQEYISHYMMEQQQQSGNATGLQSQPYHGNMEQQAYAGAAASVPENMYQPQSGAYESHPLAQYSPAQVTEHFQNLQQHFRSPNGFQTPPPAHYNMDGNNGAPPSYYSQAPSSNYEYQGTMHGYGHHQQNW